MPSRRSSWDDRKRRREEAWHRAQNRANRTAEEQLELLDRAPGVAAREVKRLKNTIPVDVEITYGGVTVPGKMYRDPDTGRVM